MGLDTETEEGEPAGPLAAYRALLVRIYPGRVVRSYLLWTDQPRLMQLSDALLEGHAP